MSKDMYSRNKPGILLLAVYGVVVGIICGIHLVKLFNNKSLRSNLDVCVCTSENCNKLLFISAHTGANANSARLTFFLQKPLFIFCIGSAGLGAPSYVAENLQLQERVFQCSVQLLKRTLSFLQKTIFSQILKIFIFMVLAIFCLL